MRIPSFASLAVLGLLMSTTHEAAAQTAPATAPPAAPEKKPDPNDASIPTQKVLYKSVQDIRSKKRMVELYLSIFEPKDHKPTDKTPVIVYFFGGGWVNGEPKVFYSQCDYFKTRGIVAISADYRTFSRHSTTPFECVADGKSVIRYIRAHAAELGIDPNKIVAAGSSAGGHVAASTALIEGHDDPADDLKVSCVPNALVLYNPVIDTSENGYGNKKLGDRWQELSPTHHVRPGMPPTIILHGTADTTVPYANATAFEAAMKAAGNDCTLITFPNIGHGFSYSLTRAAGNKATVDTDLFLAKLGYVTGAPTLAPPGK